MTLHSHTASGVAEVRRARRLCMQHGASLVRIVSGHNDIGVALRTTFSWPALAFGSSVVHVVQVVLRGLHVSSIS